jgi:hypothetical protein
MSQTTISQYGAPAYVGMLDGVKPHNVRSYAAEEIIPVGYPVKLGTNPEKEVLKATAGATAIGFALHDHAREQTSAGAVQYAATETVSTLTEGRMWVETDDAVVAGAKANLKTSNGKLTDAAVASGIEAFTQISVTFITATSAAGLALVEIK